MRTDERRTAMELLATPAGEALLRYMRRIWRTGRAGEQEHESLVRLGKLDALADLERLREEAMNPRGGETT